MKRALLLAVVLTLGGLVWSFMPMKLPVPETAPIPLPSLPAASPVRVGMLHTGSMDSQAFFAYRGGGFEAAEFGMDVVLVQHPRGLLLIDAGFGRQAREHLQTTPWLMRAVAKISQPDPAAAQLARLGVKPGQLLGVILTHAHWDHVSGLADLPGVPVYVNALEQHFITHGGDMSALVRGFGALDYQLYDFEHGPYEGFAASHDVFGDGTVVIVPAGGHTPGSVIVFVNAADRRYAFIGDLAWQHEGVDRPAERPWLARELVDVNPEQVRQDLVQLHRLQAQRPDLLIVPAHDHRVMARLPPAATLLSVSAPGG